MFKRLIALTTATALLITSQAIAAPAAITARPYDQNGRPVDPQFSILVNEDGSRAASATAANGGAAPTSTTVVGGTDASGNVQRLRTDAVGGLIGGQMIGAATRTTLTASADTALPGAGTTTRPSYFRITIETALTANLFICLNAQTCSATVYDEMIPSGAGAGTRLFEELPFVAAVRYFTTGTPTVNAARPAN